MTTFGDWVDQLRRDLAAIDEGARLFRDRSLERGAEFIELITGARPWIQDDEFVVTQAQFDTLTAAAVFPNTIVTTVDQVAGIRVHVAKPLDQQVAEAIDRINARAAYLQRLAEILSDFRHGQFTRHLLTDLTLHLHPHGRRPLDPFTITATRNRRPR